MAMLVFPGSYIKLYPGFTGSNGSNSSDVFGGKKQVPDTPDCPRHVLLRCFGGGAQFCDRGEKVFFGVEDRGSTCFHG